MQYTFKLVLFGNGGAGKTALTERYIHNTFSENTRLTIGVQLLVKRVQIGGDKVDIQIWDFGGEDRFRFLLPPYCEGAHGAIFVYDITSPRSLLDLGEWLSVIQERGGHIPIVAIGSKADLGSKRKIQFREAALFTSKFKIDNICEVSSKTGENVELPFAAITEKMIAHTSWVNLEKI